MDNNLNGVLGNSLLTNMLDTQQILAATGSLMDQQNVNSQMDMNATSNVNNSSEYNDDHDADNQHDNNTNDDNNDSNSNNNMMDDNSNGQLNVNTDMMGVNQSQKRQASDYDPSGVTPSQMSQKKRQKTGNFNNYNNNNNSGGFNKNMSGKVELRILLPSKVCFLLILHQNLAKFSKLCFFFNRMRAQLLDVEARTLKN